MKFNIELDMSDYTDEGWFDEETFRTEIKDSIAKSIANTIMDKYLTGYYAKENLDSIIRNAVNSHLNEIITQIVDRVSSTIVQKKQLVEITPRASLLAAVDNENKAYFNTLIEQCIAKKFR